MSTALFRVGVAKLACKRPVTKDRSADEFLSRQADIALVCKVKAQNPSWSKRRICRHLNDRSSALSSVTETRAGHYLEKFFYDQEEEDLFFKSTEAHSKHRRCVSKPELIKLLANEHARDHRSADTYIATLRVVAGRSLPCGSRHYRQAFLG